MRWSTFRAIGLHAVSILTVVLVASCGSAPPPSPTEAASPNMTSRSPGAPVVPSTAPASPIGSQGSCPVTKPNRGKPPDEPVESVHLGNGLLGTDLWPEGIVRARPEWTHPDGSISMKWPWWRATETVFGQVIIEGRRLDADAPPLRGESPTEGYGDTGFTPSDVTFSSPGCWEVTGRAGEATLTFVTLVVAP